MKFGYLMNMKLCVSVGVLFSLTLHFFLIGSFLRWYPDIINYETWNPSPNNKIKIDTINITVNF